MRRPPPNKKTWSAKEIRFIKDNFMTMTNSALAISLGLKLSTLRTKCISIGLKRMELEYWTDEQITFLKANYKAKGDTELAEVFEMMWPKNKGWTKKHIEKKRKYLNLKRTRHQINKIREYHRQLGIWEAGNKKMWNVRGVAPEGEIRFWRLHDSPKFFPVIKAKGTWLHWNQWKWIESNGPIPKGMNIVFRDGDFTNLTLENLELISNQELAKRNSILRFPDDLRSTIYLSARLNNKIKKLEKSKQ